MRSEDIETNFFDDKLCHFVNNNKQKGVEHLFIVSSRTHFEYLTFLCIVNQQTHLFNTSWFPKQRTNRCDGALQVIIVEGCLIKFERGQQGATRSMNRHTMKVNISYDF